MAVLAQTLIVNGANLGDYGLLWRTRDGWRSGPDTTILLHDLPGNDGKFFQETTDNMERRISIRGSIISSTIAAFNSQLDAIQARLNGFLQVQCSDDTSRFFGCYKTHFTVGGFGAQAVVPLAPYTLDLICADPRRFDVEFTTRGDSAPCDMGTARVKPTVQIFGPCSNPTTITLYDHLGNSVSSFTMSAALTIGQTWLIDSELGVVYKDDGVGGVTNVLPVFSGTFPILDPEYADYGSESWPYFSATAGNPVSLSIEYKRSWK